MENIKYLNKEICVNLRKSVCHFLFLLTFLIGGALMPDNSYPKSNIRQAAVAGLFYPQTEQDLKRDLKRYLSFVGDQDTTEDSLVYFSPHAGYVYSAPTAAHTFKQLQARKDIHTYILIGVSHQYPIVKASFSDIEYYQTPLGNIKINQDITDKLKQSDLFESIFEAHKKEHSLEVQIPFIQYINPTAQIVPILINQGPHSYLSKVADYLADIVKQGGIAVVVSTDMSHYHSKKEANKMDLATLKLIEDMNDKLLHVRLSERECELCGGAGTIIGILISKKLGSDKIKILRYSDSSDFSKDTDNVVGYFSGAAYNSLAVKQEFILSEDEKKILLNIARDSIKNVFDKKTELPQYKVHKDSILNKKRGAFVTINKNNELRGCIGYIKAIKPLWETVSEMAVAAAMKDNRFAPLKPGEFNEIKLEISVLSELEKIDDINKIKVGRHGLYIQKGFNSGLLLPQVAVEYGWDRNEFLEHTCKKAGLPADAWKNKDTEIFMFLADVFSEMSYKHTDDADLTD